MVEKTVYFHRGHAMHNMHCVKGLWQNFTSRFPENRILASNDYYL